MRAGPFAPNRLLGFSAPMLVWAMHFVLAYGLQGLSCSDQANDVRWLQGGLLTTLLVILTLVALALLGWLGRRAWRCQREVGPPRRFLPAATLLASVMATIAVVFTATPLFLLSPCR